MVGFGLHVAMSQTQSMRQTQTMTPQLRNLVRVLEVSDVQLRDVIDEEIFHNPALSRIYRGVRDTQADARRVGGAAQSAEHQQALENLGTSGEVDFQSDLLEQLRFLRLDDDEVRAAKRIIINLGGDGILEGSLAAVAQDAGVSLEVAERAQQIVMTKLEPNGCGATTKVAYLIFEVGRRWPEDPFFAKLLENHYMDLTRSRFAYIAKRMEMDEEDVEEYQKMLSGVPPYPLFGHGGVSAPEPSCPSFRIDEDPSDPLGFAIHMYEDAQKLVHIPRGYAERTYAMAEGEEKQERLLNLANAQRLLQALEERHSLIKEVATQALQAQIAYFQTGEPARLQNLTMATVAQTLGRDTSTVSRAVSERYYLFRGETFELRKLFTNRGPDQTTSAEALKEAIRVLIEAENPASPLSDQKLSDKLERAGHSGVARRTVQKYREMMEIPSSRDRKKRG